MSLKDIKHLSIKCPICGNDDFIQIKESVEAINWTVESETSVYGCTKCFYLIHFCEDAVMNALDNEDDVKRLRLEIENNKKELLKLEEESKALEAKIEASNDQEKISELKKILECDIKQRIKWFEQEIKNIEDGLESNEWWPDYNCKDRLYNSIDFLKEKIIELEKKIK